MNESLKVAQRTKVYVKNYLERTGKKQEFLAEELGYTPKRFSQLINSRAVMGIDDLLNIARYFKEPLSKFVGDVNERRAG